MNQHNIARKGAYHRVKRTAGIAMLVGLLALLASCSGDGTVAPPPVVVPPPPPAAIPGDPAALLKNAILSVDVGDVYTDAEVSTDANGVEIVRTKIEIAFRNSARLGEVNDLLAAHGARVTTSLAGVPGVVIRIPDPGSLAALDALVAQIEGQVFVWFVRRAELPSTNALPVNINPAAPNPEHLTVVRHHIGVRGPAAWNLAARAESTPAVMVMDYFGNGTPNEDLAYQYLGDAAADFANVATPSEHGYHVAGIISGRYGGGSTDRGLVTGMMPRPVRLSVIDLKKHDPLDGENRLLQRAESLNSGERIVVSTSLNGGVCNTSITCFPLDHLLVQGAWWAIKVQTLALDERILHLTSAGNIKDPFPDVDDAQFNSAYGTAALRQDLVDFDGAAIARLTNTLAIENVALEPSIPFGNPCLSAGSFHGGHLAGVGADVWSFTNSSSAASEKSGTSMSTPQVAGLAAYLLAIDPSLSPQQIIAILQATARPIPVLQEQGCSAHPTPSPLIDAYAAVLALDSEAALTSGSLFAARMRGELLDRDHDGDFDDTDLMQILQQLDTGAGVRDYGPWDLNGDGLTGADSRDSLDLNINRLLEGGVEIDIEGEATRFDETALTDYDIACFYAYSALYGGDESMRDALLTPYRELGLCGTPADINVTITFPTAIAPFTDVPLTVQVLDGNDDPLEGLLIELVPTGGTVADASGTTDAAGNFETTAMLADESPQISIAVAVRDAESGEVLYQQTVVANVFVPIELSVTVNPQTLESGVPATVQIQTLPNHLLELTVMNSSGILGASSGTSDLLGSFETTVTNAAGYACTRFIVRAYQTQGGPELAQQDVVLSVNRAHAANGSVRSNIHLNTPDNSTESISFTTGVVLSSDAQCRDPVTPPSLPSNHTWDYQLSSGPGFVQGTSSSSLYLDGNCSIGIPESGTQIGSSQLSLNNTWPDSFGSQQLQVFARARAELQGSFGAALCFGTGNRSSSSDVTFLGGVTLQADANVTFSSSMLRSGSTSSSNVIVRFTRNYPIGTIPDYVACARLAPSGLVIECQTGVPVTFSGQLPAGQYWVYGIGTTEFDRPDEGVPEIEFTIQLDSSP